MSGGAVVEVASQIGIPIDAERVTLTPDDVATSVVLGERNATVFELGLVDSRAQESVANARAILGYAPEDDSEMKFADDIRTFLVDNSAPGGRVG